MKARPGSLPEENSSASAHDPVVRAVCLVGFMGAGKSSVGKALGRQLGWPFVDLDERIQSREKRTIEEIFRQSGKRNSAAWNTPHCASCYRIWIRLLW
jgi:hypothetical protein